MDDRTPRQHSGAKDRAARVFEERNRAFRVLYDTVFEVEGASDERIYAILCRNLRRISGAACACFSSFNPLTSTLKHEAADIAEDHHHCAGFRGNQGETTYLEPELVAELLENQVCCSAENRNRLMEQLCGTTGCSNSDAPRYCLSCIREGELIAVGQVRLLPGAKLRLKDMVDTYLNFAGVILQRVNAARELRESEQKLRQQAELLLANNLQLEAQQQQLEAQKCTLEEFNAALEAAKASAEAANVSKGRFLANMSHEIRTPMTAILGFADVLRDEIGWCTTCSAHEECNRRAQACDAIDIICRNGTFLLDIINDILDLSKIDAGRLIVERTPCSLRQIVADVTSLMRKRSDDKGLALVVEYKEPLPFTIQCDPTRLRQILINTIGNAIKFTEKGSVRLVVRFTDQRNCRRLIELDVIDTGVGMTARQVDKVFEPFAQADASTTRRFGGTGLGLTICKRLARMLGGDIIVAHTTPGVGTCIRISIDPGPLDSSSFVECAVAPAFEEDCSSHPAESMAAGELDDVRILLAEDGPDNQRLISHVLRKAGGHVTTVENGRLAVDAAFEALRQGCPFHVILMDMQMPEMDGYEASRVLRSQRYAGPIIALTAHAMATDRGKCLSAGCDDHATKPINRETLIATIRKHLATPAPAP